VAVDGRGDPVHIAHPAPETEWGLRCRDHPSRGEVLAFFDVSLETGHRVIEMAEVKGLAVD
jgi:hypothetical protein